MTLTGLKGLCRLWQKRLKILDWTVSVRWGNDGELPEEYGICDYDPRQMIAEVVIRSGVDPKYPNPDIEQTLIHELLHVVLHGDKDYDKEDILQERAINQITEALFFAYCKKRKK